MPAKGVLNRIDWKCPICERVLQIIRSRTKNKKTCSKECRAIFMTGHKPFNWKGGRLIHKGYVYLLRKEHPAADRDGYVLEHRIIVEESIGRYLRSDEVIHHKNGNRSDNRLENLEQVGTQSDHMKEHWERGKWRSKKHI